MAKHQDLIKDNNINVSELPKATQELISKFSAITDPAQSAAMDDKIYKQIEKHATDKNKPAEGAETKKPDGVDVSAAATSKKEEEKKPEPPKSKSPLSTIFGSK